MIKHTFLFIIALYFCAGTVSAKPSLIFLGGADKKSSQKYCSQVTDITQQAADDLAISWRIPSASITLRNARLSQSGVLCCITLDTLKGPFVNMAYEYYLFGEATIADMNNRGYLEGEQGRCR
jgi:hypothetical protein